MGKIIIYEMIPSDTDLLYLLRLSYLFRKTNMIKSERINVITVATVAKRRVLSNNLRGELFRMLIYSFERSCLYPQIDEIPSMYGWNDFIIIAIIGAKVNKPIMIMNKITPIVLKFVFQLFFEKLSFVF